MSLSRKKKATLLASTATAAKALVEDLHHIREVLARRSTSKGEIRRLSAVIRRLLVDGDLLDVASPRVGRLLVQAPDCKRFYEAAKYGEVLFFASGGAPVFGAELLAMLMLRYPRNKDILPELTQDVGESYGLVEMRLDNFLAQKVLCMNGEWISRRAAIKHIANYGSGIHTKEPDNREDLVVSMMRNCATYAVEDGKVKAHILPFLGEDSVPVVITVEPPWEDPFPVDVLDPVLLEVLAAGALLVNSPGIAKLEAIIASEPLLAPSPNVR